MVRMEDGLAALECSAKERASITNDSTNANAEDATANTSALPSLDVADKMRSTSWRPAVIAMTD
jgi:hypothetical protein